jgi:adenylate cyclase
MSNVFISYARSTAKQAQAVAEALRALGYSVWIDDDLPAHRTYSRVIEEQMTAAKAAVVIWSADAVKSEWVMSEANRAREDRKLVQAITDAARLPMPFDTIQCADLAGWTGDTNAAGWRKVVASVADLIGGSAAALQPALAAPAADAPLPLPSKPSIAVMPFANLSGDPEQEYFADGMVAEITGALSRFKSLFVIASSSTLTFKGKAVGAQEAARRLGVRYVLEGSVRRSGSRIRIAVQLIDAADGAQVWSERFDDTLEDVFDLQDNVALAVAGKIEPTIQKTDNRRAIDRPTDNMGSYELYQRAFALSQTGTKAETLSALALLDRAIRLDPHYGGALALAAYFHALIVPYGWSEDPESDRRQGIGLARRAQKAQGDDAETIAYVAWVVSTLERDNAAAVALIDRALALNPGSSSVWNISGMLRLRAGDLDAAAEHLGTSMRLDPLSPFRWSQLGNLGRARFHQGRFVEAIAPLKEATKQSDAPFFFLYLAATHGYLGEAGAAREALNRYGELSSQPIADMVGAFTHDPAQPKQVLAGIALAEGKSPTDAPAGAP